MEIFYKYGEKHTVFQIRSRIYTYILNKVKEYVFTFKILFREDGHVSDLIWYRVHFFGKNPNPDSESKNGFFVSLAKSKKGL